MLIGWYRKIFKNLLLIFSSFSVAIWIENGKTRANCWPLKFITQNNAFKNLHRKISWYFSAISMDIPEKRTFLCTVVRPKIIPIRLENFPFYYQNLREIFNLKIVISTLTRPRREPRGSNYILHWIIIIRLKILFL